MKVKLALLLRCFALLIITVLALLIVVDAYFELVGVPAPLVHKAQSHLRDEWGVKLEVGRLRLGLLRGGHAEDVRASGGREVNVSLQAAKLSFQPSLGDFVTGRFRPDTVTIREGTLAMCGNGLTPSSRECILQIREAQGDFDGDDLSSFSLNGQLGNVSVRATGCILDLLGKKSHSPVTRARSTSEGDPGMTWFSRIAERLNDLNLNPARAHVELDVRACASTPSVTSVSGRIALRDVIYRSVVVRLLEADVKFARGEVTVGDALLLTEGGDHMEGGLTVWLDDRLIAGRLAGEVRPATLRRVLAPQPVADNWLLQSFDAHQPLEFEATLQPSPFTRDGVRLSGSISGRHIRFRGVPASRLSAQISYAGDRLTVDNLEVQWSEKPGQSDLVGSFMWWPGRQQIAGKAYGLGGLLARLSALGADVPQALQKVNWGPNPPRIGFELAPSPVDWRRWKCEIPFAADDVRYGRWDVHRLSGTITLSSGTLGLREGRLDWDEKGTGSIGLNGEVSLTELLDHSRAACRVDLTCLLPSRVEPQAQDGGPNAQPRATALIAIDRSGPTTTISADLEGVFRPAELYQALRAPLRLPHSRIAARIIESGPPAEVKLHLEPCKWPLRSWLVQGKIEAKDIGYKSLKIRSVRADLHATPEHILFQNIEAITQAGDTLSLDIDINLDPASLWLRDGVLRGDPGLVAVFIEDRKGRSVYEAIWRDFEWDDANPPTVRLEKLVHRFDPVSRDWDLRMKAHISIENAKYRDFDTSAISADIHLSLPGAVSISNVEIRKGKSLAKGNVRILTEGLPSCRFQLSKLSGGCDPKSILRVIHPGWEGILGDFTFAPDTEITCRGTFFLDEQPNLRLDRGTLATSSCRYKSLEFRDVNGSWGVDGTHVMWNIPKARLYGGEASVTGHHDAMLNQGGLAVKVSQVKLVDLLSDLGVTADSDSLSQSRLAGNCRLTFLRGWSDMDLQLSGNGRIRISESNLWSIPIFAQLGQLVRMSSLGRISAIEADLNFNGERVVVPALSTNGTIISLSGNGEYSWQSGKLNFRIHGEPLKGVRPLSLVLRPLSWVFDAHLSGTLEDHRWRMISVLEKALSGKGTTDVNVVD